MMRKKQKHRIKTEKVTGILEKNRRGFGFIRREDGDDIFVGRNNMFGAMHGDTVQSDIVFSPLSGKREGVVNRIIARGSTEVVGTFQRNKKFGFVIPSDKRNDDDIFVKKADFRGAQNGDKVVVKITRYPEKYACAQGKITEIISRYGDKGSEIKALIRDSGLYETFPSRVRAEAKVRSKESVPLADLRHRRDLRGKTTITIDGPSAKDLDDAVSIEKLPTGNYLLGVHIADVSHYVKEGGYLDQEALKRGNSVYLINRVVPMLPKSLSNGICSLNPDEDRLTLSCQMEFDKNGNLLDHAIFESIICSRARMIYDDVSDILEKEDPMLIERYRSIHEDLLLMGELAEILREKRKQRGSLDFDFDEAEIQLDENEVPVSVDVEPRRGANRLIEEFMLAANQTVAEHFFWMNYPFIYRVHEKPDPDRIQELKAFLAGFGIGLPGNPDNIHPKALSNILENLEGKPFENIISTVMLKSMKKAYYSTECQGHFGLSFQYYCHFTSPIRRYPDLFIHRVIKSALHGTADEKKLNQYRRDASQAAEIASATERKAQKLEREVERMKKAQYMEQRIGETYDGIISGVTGYGIYVQLPNTVEGLVPLDSLKDDFYDYEAKQYRLIGRNNRRIFALGDQIRVVVAAADAENRQIEFVLARDADRM